MWMLVAMLFATCMPRCMQAQDATLVARQAAALFGGDARLAALMRPGDYGVPRSPAFELLPEQPSEVTHLVTPHDFQSNLKSWYDGGKVKAGIAVDTRPFARAGGSLTDYQSSARRRVAFGTILSAGTATAVTGSKDVLGALGLRIPLVDRADPRLDSAYLASLAKAYNQSLIDQGPLPLNATDSVKDARALKASKAGEPVRRQFAKTHWNVLRIELGLAGSATSASGAARRDSVTSDAGGAWLGVRLPIESYAQLSVAAKGRWSRASRDSTETQRLAAGARVLGFLGDELSLSVETSWVRADHSRLASLDDSWLHLGAVLEWYVPELGGWIGAGYGGDRQRSRASGNQFSLQYAVYTDRLIGSR
jgi:hypothetical protein